MSTAARPPKSNLYSFVEENLDWLTIETVDRKYWNDITGMEYIDQLAFKGDKDSIKVSVEGNYFAACCFAAVSSANEMSLVMVMIDSYVL